MKVKVRYFAAHKEMAGVAEEMVELWRGATVADLVDRLVAIHPRLDELRKDTIVSVNRGVGSDEIVLEDGDDVALLPPISGG